jgi:hypothetical protein
MAVWEKLDDVSKNIADEPWSLYWSEYKSGTEEFEDFLHDPLSVLVKACSGVDRTWNVQTSIIGHEIGFRKDAVCSTVLVDPIRKIAYVTFYKHQH